MKLRPLRRGDPAEVEDLTRLWHETKQVAYPYLPLEQGRTLAEDAAFMRERLLPACEEVWVAEREGILLGFLALEGDCLDRLYVHPDHQRTGVGSALWAKILELRPGGFELFTHVENGPARAFYEAKGCQAVAFGVSPPPESMPDVLYRWSDGPSGCEPL